VLLRGIARDIQPKVDFLEFAFISALQRWVLFLLDVLTWRSSGEIVSSDG
jgi:hypothetical protein